jgi:hypothetical protein
MVAYNTWAWKTTPIAIAWRLKTTNTSVRHQCEEEHLEHWHETSTWRRAPMWKTPTKGQHQEEKKKTNQKKKSLWTSTFQLKTENSKQQTLMITQNSKPQILKLEPKPSFFKKTFIILVLWTLKKLNLIPFPFLIPKKNWGDGGFQSRSPNPPYTWFRVLLNSINWFQFQLGFG